MHSTRPPAGPAWPLHVPILPNGKLSAVIHKHSMTSMVSGTFDCWTFVSQGLLSVNQKEVVFTVRRRPTDADPDFPGDPMSWFKLLYSLAEKGPPVDAWARTEFRSESFFGRSDIQMIIYAPYIVVSGVPEAGQPADMLQAIALTRLETEMIKSSGTMRILGHLGLSERWFPFPPWIDRDRGDCVTEQTFENTVRGMFPLIMIDGPCAYKKGGEVRLYLPKRCEKRVAEEILGLEPENVIGVDSGLHPEADSLLVWSRGDEYPNAIGTGNTTDFLNLCFIAFCPQQAEDKMQITEDGCIVFLTDPTWASIRTALSKSESITVPLGENGVSFRLELVRMNYQDPISGSTLHMDSGWRTYEPRGPPKEPKPASHVELTSTVFIKEPRPGECDVKELVGYMNVVLDTLRELIPTEKPDGVAGQQIIVDMTIEPGAETGELMFRVPDGLGLDVGQLLARMTEVKCPVVQAETRLQLFVGLWGYKGGEPQFK